MRLCKVYSVNGLVEPRSAITLPLSVDLDGVTVHLDTEDDQLVLTVQERIDPSAVALAVDGGWFREDAHGNRVTLPTLTVRAHPSRSHVVARDVVSAIAFARNWPLQLGALMNRSRLLADDEEDRQLLSGFGTDRVAESTHVEYFKPNVSRALDAQVLRTLAKRTVGVRLYADALRAGYDVAKYREHWRVLESAFGVQDQELARLLPEFPPLKAMGLTRKESKALLVLRHRASHARSKAGITELIRVEASCREQLSRLKSIVETVVSAP